MYGTGSTEISRFVLRRVPSVFEEGTPVAGSDIGLLIGLGGILLLGFFFIGLMYYKDSSSVGWAWASLLGLLRASVYVVLALVFLLPAMQKFEEHTVPSKVILLFDVSGSMLHTMDDPLPEGVDPNKVKMPTRQDKVLNLLTDEQVALLNRLTEKNLVSAYRFGASLDERFLQFTPDHFFTRPEWEELIRHPEKQRELGSAKHIPNEFLSCWLNPHLAKGMKPATDWDNELETRFGQVRDYSVEMEEKHHISSNTNVTQALSEILAREGKNPVQAIVIVSDGRSHLRSADSLDDLKRKAKEIPIFVVGVGTTRQQARIEIVDLRHPKVVQPDDPFRVVVEIKGDGLPNEEIQELQVEMTRVRIIDKGKDKVEEELDMGLVEQRPPKRANPDDKEQPKVEPLGIVPIGKKIVFRPDQPPRLDTSARPRATVEFPVDPSVLARNVAAIIAKDPKNAPERSLPQALLTILDSVGDNELQSRVVALEPAAMKEVAEKTDAKLLKHNIENFVRNPAIKWGLGENGVNEEYRFKVSIKKHPSDTSRDDDHLKKKGGVRVIKKPLSVLVFSSTASKDYQFLREALLREMQKGVLTVTVRLQSFNPARREWGDIEREITGQEKSALNVVQGLPRLWDFLSAFPNKYTPDAPENDPRLKDRSLEKQKDESESQYELRIHDTMEAWKRDLGNYDVIVGIDADWTKLPKTTTENIARWVEAGGGLVLLGGPIYTNRLARPGSFKDRLEPLIKLLPVELKDVDAERDEERVEPDQPWPLIFDQATPDLEFLKLAEDPEKGTTAPFLSDWAEMFKYDENAKERLNGIYSFVPVKKVVPGSRVVARFGNPSVKSGETPPRPMPYLVITDPQGSRRVVWIGSSETWRLRRAKNGTAYHERFWTKLLRFVGANTQSKVNRFVMMEMGGPYSVDQFIRVDVRLMTKEGKPLPREEGEKAKLTITPRGGQGKQITPEIKERPGGEGMYFAQFRIQDQGVYDVQLEATGGKETGVLEILPSDPEKDDTRPDFNLLYDLSSEMDSPAVSKLTTKMDPQQKSAVIKRLQRPKLEKDVEKSLSAEPEKPKLFFDLTNAEMIPSCMDNGDVRVQSRGKPEDLWDRGFWDDENGKPRIAYVLAALVGLLSLEWLIRKLLRLA